MRILFVVSTALLCIAGSASAASMYKCVETGGKVSYADHPCTDAEKEAWSSQLGSRSKAPKQIARPAPAEPRKPEALAKAGAGTARSSDDAQIEALRLDEMTRILGQQHD